MDHPDIAPLPPSQPAKKPRGSSSGFAATEDRKALVLVRAAVGWSHEDIAADLGTDVETLKERFSDCLNGAALQLQGQLLDVLHRKALEGHLPSMTALQARIVSTKPAAKPRAVKAVDDEAAPVVKAVPLGKKAQKLAEAQNVPDEWGRLMQMRQDRAS